MPSREALFDVVVGLVSDAVDERRFLVEGVHVPVVAAAEEGAAEDVAEAGGDDAFPDVEAHGDVRLAEPDALWRFVW